MGFYYAYVLRSLKDHPLYTVFTKELNARIERHNRGLVESTKNRVLFELIYSEGCNNEKDGVHRQRYLNSTYGKHYIRNRLRHFLSDVSELWIFHRARRSRS